MFGKRLSESVDIWSDRGIRHTDDLRPMGPQQGVEIEIAGIVHEHRVAGFDQKAGHKIDRLRARFRQHDLFGGGRDAAVPHAPRQKLAQGRQAEWRAVLGERGAVGAGKRAESSSQDCFRKP
jgi:hypothetical protein